MRKSIADLTLRILQLDDDPGRNRRHQRDLTTETQDNPQATQQFTGHDARETRASRWGSPGARAAQRRVHGATRPASRQHG